MKRENQPLVRDEPVEYEKSAVEAQDFMRITYHFRGIERMQVKVVKKKWKMSTRNRLDLENTRISSEVYPKISPDTAFLH